MYKFLENTPVLLTCHACGKAQEKKMKWVKKNKTLKCKKCDEKIDLTKKDIKKAMHEVARAVSAFEMALGKLHKATTPVKKKSSSKRVRKAAPVDASPETVAQGKRSFV